ncbi:TPA: hypothetical protein ACUNF5_004475 [Burkholderia orbicola]
MNQVELGMKLLKEAVAKHGCGAVAKMVKRQKLVKDAGQKPQMKLVPYSSATISLASRDKYPGDVAKLAQRVLEAFGTRSCPHTNTVITLEGCLDVMARRPPSNNATLLGLMRAHQRACRTCPHRPIEADKNAERNGEHHE